MSSTLGNIIVLKQLRGTGQKRGDEMQISSIRREERRNAGYGETRGGNEWTQESRTCTEFRLRTDYRTKRTTITQMSVWF